MFSQNKLIHQRQFGVKNLHLRNLLVLLKQLLLQHDFHSATQIISILTPSYKKCRNIVFKAGMEALRNLSSTIHEQARHFYRKMITLDKDNREIIILELAFYNIKRSYFRDAVSTLESYLEVDPYRTNPLFHGYCGVACYLEWEREINNIATNQRLTTVRYEQLTNRGTDYYNKARHHLGRALELSPTCSDTFVYHYTRLLTFKKENQAALSFLQEYCARAPKNPNTHRYVLSFVECYYPTNTDLLLKHVRTLLELDPANDYAFNRLVKMFSEGHDVPIDEVIDCTVNRLHYRLKDATLWQLLARLLREKKNNEQLETETSKERSWRLTVHWWKHALFHPQIQRVELKNTDREVLIYKSICSGLLFGEQCDYFVYIQRYFQFIKDPATLQKRIAEFNMHKATVSTKGKSTRREENSESR
jgi:tetratricopeptide (TPR) repeat protein